MIQRDVFRGVVEFGALVAEEIGAEGGMLLHYLVLFRGELPRLFQDGVRDGDLADVVDHRGHAQDVPLCLDLGPGHPFHDRPAVVNLYRVSRHAVHVRARFLRVAHLGHSDCPQDDVAGEARPVQGHGGGRGEMQHDLFVHRRERNDPEAVVLGIDYLEHADQLIPHGDQRHGEHGTAAIARLFIEPASERVRRAAGEIIDVGDVQDLSGGGAKARDRIMADRQGKSGIDELCARRELPFE